MELQLHQGVYFRPLGEVIVTGSDWTICTSISLVTYHAAYTNITGQVDQVVDRINDIEQATTEAMETAGPRSQTADHLSKKLLLVNQLRRMWETLIGDLKRDLSRYQADLSTIKQAMGGTQGISSRGLIDIVSDAGKFLFGFSTEKDTKRLSDRVDELANRDRNLTHLIEHQFTYIRDVATQTLHNGEQILRLKASLGGVAAALQALHDASSALELGARFTGLGLELLTAMSLIREAISQSWKGLDTVRRITARAGEGKLAWELFEGTTFNSLLGEVGRHLPTGWKLLYDARDHYAYLHYVATETYRTKEGMNLCMSIPIVKTSSRYQLYEAIPMPIVHPEFPDKLFFTYKFESVYLAMQKAGTDYFTAQSGEPINFFTMNDHRETKCIGNEPRVCSLHSAVRTPSNEDSDCLYDLFTDRTSSPACPVQVQYHDGPIFRHVGMGVWLYGAAKGTLRVQCSEQANRTEHSSQYQLTGTGAFRLQPGCEASLGRIKVPSYVNGKGQFKLRLPDAPIVNVFSLNFSKSVWSNITSELPLPGNMTAFLSHLSENTDIQKSALELEAFNHSIQNFQLLQSKWYHPLHWATHPEGQVSGFSFLFLLNVTSIVLLTVGYCKLRRRLNAMTPHVAPPPIDEARPLVVVRRRRRRQVEDQTV